MTDLTVVGTGQMGSSVASRFLDIQTEVTVWNRTADKALRLVEQGAKLGATAADAIAASPVTVFVLDTYDSVRSVLADCGRLDGQHIVNLTTGTPEDARALEAVILQSGGRYLDGVLLCYPGQIGSTDAVIRYAGAEESWDEYGHLLSMLGGRTRFLGPDTVAANVMDLIGLSVTTPLMVAALEVGAYAKRHGIPFADVVAEIADMQPIITDMLRGMVPAADEDAALPEQATLGTYRAGVEGCLESMRRAELYTPVLAASVEYMRAAADRFGADTDFSAMFGAVGRGEEIDATSVVRSNG